MGQFIRSRDVTGVDGRQRGGRHDPMGSSSTPTTAISPWHLGAVALQPGKGGQGDDVVVGDDPGDRFGLARATA